MFSQIQRIFTAPTPLERATIELVDAEHAKLEAQSAVEYAASLVTYNEKRIARLSKYINEATKETT